MDNLKLEEYIDAVKKDEGLRPNATVKKLRPLLKAFLAYSTTADSLPPPTLIPVCLFTLPKLLKTILALPEGEYLRQEPEKAGLKLCLQLYLKGMLRLLGECEEEIKQVVVQSMSQSMELIHAFPLVAKKWVRALVEIFSTSSDNLNLGLRVFLSLQRAFKGGNDEFFIWGLRRLYVGYFEHCGQITWRTLEHINFMGNCFCEMTRINPEKSYYVLFGYVRALAMQVHGLNNAKGRQKKELTVKLYSQQIIQALRLLGQVVGQGSQELSALIYPLCELMSAYERISESPEYLPLKLHILQFELQLMEHTGLYLPHTPETILKIFKSSPLQRKSSRKARFEGSIELGYKLSFEELKNTNVLNSLFEKSLFYLYWVANLASKLAGGVELVRQIVRLAKDIRFGFSGHSKALKQTLTLFKKDIEIIEEKRFRRKLSLLGLRTDKFEVFLAKGTLPLEARQKYQQLVAERENLFKAKVVAERHDNPEDGSEDEEAAGDEQSELESGWEEASEGASEFDEPEAPDSEASVEGVELQEVSYSGDPEDPDEAVKEWSQHEWSSQEQEPEMDLEQEQLNE